MFRAWGLGFRFSLEIGAASCPGVSARGGELCRLQHVGLVPNWVVARCTCVASNKPHMAVLI